MVFFLLQGRIMTVHRDFFQLPTDGSNPNLDVLLNIHSGAFMYGWGHEFGPEILMDRDIIWITINYRLGAFGKLHKYTIYHRIKIYLQKKKTLMS